MDRKKITKGIKRFLSWVGFGLCSLIIRCIPGRFLYAVGKGIAGIAYLFAGKQRRIALESLKFAFGNDKDSKQIEQIARQCFVHMAKSAVELMYLMDKPEILKRRVSIGNKEVLDAALAKGQGIILVSAHFGNFPLLLARLSLEGYTAGGIMKPMRDARMEKIFLAKRERFKVKTIYSQPRKECVDSSIRALRNNEIVFIPLDQNFGTGGVFVEFFGRKAATATGPVVLAQRTGAALLPCFIIRQLDDTHRIVFEPPLALEGSGTPQETIVRNVQRLTGIIESYIRKYPAEWGWIHRRWKSRPGAEEGGM